LPSSVACAVNFATPNSANTAADAQA
jgi:hypothetical protein